MEQGGYQGGIDRHCTTQVFYQIEAGWLTWKQLYYNYEPSFHVKDPLNIDRQLFDKIIFYPQCTSVRLQIETICANQSTQQKVCECRHCNCLYN